MFKKPLLIFSLTLGCLLGGVTSVTAACAKSSVAGAGAVVTPGRIDQALLDAAILAEVNFERCRKGLSALVTEPRLRATAETHSRWMAKTQTVSHDSTVRGQQSLRDRLKHSGVSFRAGAENIGMLHYFQIDGRTFLTRNSGSCKFAAQDGTPLPPHSYESLARAAVSYWMASPGHRKNILNRKVKMVGTAASVNTGAEFCGTVYLTQTFAG